MSYLSRPAVAIVGAGPYGISIAAHLESAGIAFRIFGRPMNRWRHQMPRGMLLRSEGFASNLSDPRSTYTLARYCTERAIPYEDIGAPISLEVFTQYARWFQLNLSSTVEDVTVTGVDTALDGFRLELSDGTTELCSKVVLATGLEHTTRIPPAFASLPPDLVSHSSDHYDLKRFVAKDVVIIGGGQSALELAALLTELGASVRLLCRRPSLAWTSSPRSGPRSLYQRLRYPRSGLGDGLKSWFYCSAPALFRRLPQPVRMERAYSTLGPAGAWWLKERVLGRAQILIDHFVAKAEATAGGVLLRVVGPDGQSGDLIADHVIAATGYRFDLQRLPFLSRRLKSEVQTFLQQPILSSDCESSVRGLYFTGLASASSLGPSMRFLVGTGYTARVVSRHIASGLGRYKGARPTFEFATR